MNVPAITIHRSLAIRFLTLCGSLRARSSNKALLDAVARIAPRGIEVVHYERLAALPPFNPDADVDPAPTVVKETLRVMSAAVIEEACLTLPIAGRGLDAAAIAVHPELSVSLRTALDRLAVALPITR